MVWVGSVLENHLIAVLCHEQGHIPLDQLAQNPIHPHLEHSQREIGRVMK